MNRLPMSEPRTLAARQTLLRAYLESGVREGARRRLVRPEWRFGSYEEVVYTLGQSFDGMERPDNIVRGPMKYCYMNTLDLVRANPDTLTYCEGYAIPATVAFPVLHAWTITAERLVIDPTWEDAETSAYWGIPFPLADVERFMARSVDHVGIIASDYLEDFSLLRAGMLFS